jgi:hypothetical protein
MPEADARDEKNFYEDVPAQSEGFFVKGAGSYEGQRRGSSGSTSRSSRSRRSATR